MLTAGWIWFVPPLEKSATIKARSCNLLIPSSSHSPESRSSPLILQKLMVINQVWHLRVFPPSFRESEEGPSALRPDIGKLIWEISPSDYGGTRRTIKEQKPSVLHIMPFARSMSFHRATNQGYSSSSSLEGPHRYPSRMRWGIAQSQICVSLIYSHISRSRPNKIWMDPFVGLGVVWISSID